MPLAKWDLLFRVFDHPDFNPIYPIMCRCGSPVALWYISSVWIKLIHCAFVTFPEITSTMLWYQTGCISSHQEHVRNKLLCVPQRHMLGFNVPACMRYRRIRFTPPCADAAQLLLYEIRFILDKFNLKFSWIKFVRNSNYMYSQNFTFLDYILQDTF